MSERDAQHNYPPPAALLPAGVEQVRPWPAVTDIVRVTWAKPGLPGWYAKETATFALGDDPALMALLWEANDPTVAPLVQAKRRAEAVKLAAARPGEIAGEAADVGKLFHRAAEARVKGQRIDMSDDERRTIAPFMKTLERFLVEMDPNYLWMEATVYNRRHEYGGTSDAGITFGKPLKVVCQRQLVHTFRKRARLVGDYKSGNSVWDESSLQVTGYAKATHIDLKDEAGTLTRMPRTDGGCVIHVRPDGYWVHGVLTNREAAEAFYNARNLYEYIKHRAVQTIGIGLQGGTDSIYLADVGGIDSRIMNQLAAQGVLTLADLEGFGRAKFRALDQAGPGRTAAAAELLEIEDRTWDVPADEPAQAAA